MTRPTDVVMLTEQLPDLGAWTEHFVGAEVPVLAETSDALESLRTDEDTSTHIALPRWSPTIR